jgi:hypothetical protein
MFVRPDANRDGGESDGVIQHGSDILTALAAQGFPSFELVWYFVPNEQGHRKIPDFPKIFQDLLGLSKRSLSFRPMGETFRGGPRKIAPVVPVDPVPQALPGVGAGKGIGPKSILLDTRLGIFEYPASYSNEFENVRSIMFQDRQRTFDLRFQDRHLSNMRSISWGARYS